MNSSCCSDLFFIHGEVLFLIYFHTHNHRFSILLFIFANIKNKNLVEQLKTT
jgi:hypothetical protein